MFQHGSCVALATRGHSHASAAQAEFDFGLAEFEPHELSQVMFLARAASGAMRAHRSELHTTLSGPAGSARATKGAHAAVPPPVQRSGLHTSGAVDAGTFDYPTLSRAKLVRLEGGRQVPLAADASSLWRDTGAVFFAIRRPGWGFVREQGRLLAQLDLGNVPLIGVVHELVDDEPLEFQRAAFSGNHRVIHDPTKAFFPLETSLASVLSPQFVRNMIKLVSSGLPAGNNLTGDYKYASGVAVVGPGDQGILYQSAEETLGDHVDTDAVLEAVAKFSRPAAPGV